MNLECFKMEFKTTIDSKTKKKVVQLTTDGSNSYHFGYDNLSFSRDNRFIVYYSDRGGKYNLYKMSLEDGETIRLTDTQALISLCSHLAWDDKYIYYIDGRTVKVTDIESLETKEISLLKKGYLAGHVSLTSDNRYFFYNQYETKGARNWRGPNYAGFKENFETIKSSYVTRLDVKTGKSEDIIHEEYWINHVKVCPTDSNIVLYCHEGPWHLVDQRM